MYSTQLWLHNGKQSTVMKYDLAGRPIAGNLAQTILSLASFFQLMENDKWQLFLSYPTGISFQFHFDNFHNPFFKYYSGPQY